MYFFVIILILFISSLNFAKDGDIDSTFGNLGDISIISPNGNFRPVNALKLSDGKIILGGWGYGNIILAKIDENGNLITSFGNNGFSNLTYTQFIENHYVYDIKELSNQKLLILGRYDNYRFISRLESNGFVDTTFGTNGKVIIPYGEKIQFQQNGKIIINYKNSNVSNFSRYNTNGTLDSSFAANGVKQIYVPNKSVNISDFLVQNDDKIVFCGSFNGESMIGRLNPDGSYDVSITSGNSSIPLGFSTIQKQVNFYKLILGENSKVYAIGTKGTFDTVIARFNSNLQLDIGYGVSGFYEENNSVYLNRTFGPAILQFDNKILLSSSDFPFLKRINQNGTRDFSFGDSLYIGNNNFNPVSLIIQKDAKIILICEEQLSGQPYKAVLQRFKNNGEIFPSQQLVDFGAIGYGQQKTKSISFSNLASGTLYIENFNYGNQISLDTNFLNTLPIYLGTGESITFEATVSPNKVGPKSLSFQILGNSITNPEYYSFQFIGVGPEANVDKTELIFQNLIMGSNEVLKDSIILTNTGNIELTFNNISLNGDSEFSINFDGNSILQPGFSKSVFIDFQSQNLGVFSTDLLINSNASENSSLIVPINVELIALNEKEESNQLPKEFSLSQNYPNPFNPITKITFGIPKFSDVSLKVYNVLGQKVKTLVERELSPSFHTFEWNGTDDSGNKVSNGIYFYKIEADNFTDTKKMLLLK